MIIPADASVSVQAALRDLNERVQRAEQAVSRPVVSPDVLAQAVASLRKEIAMAVATPNRLSSHEFDLAHRIPFTLMGVGADKSIPNNANTAVILETEYHLGEVKRLWDVSNPTRLTYIEPGLYLVGACVPWESLNGLGRRRIFIARDGNVADIVAVSETAIVQNATVQVLVGLDRATTLGRYIELYAFQDSGVAVKVLGSVFGVQFWCAFLGR